MAPPRWDWNVRFSHEEKEWITAEGPERERVHYSVVWKFFRFSGFTKGAGGEAAYVPEHVITSILELAGTADDG